MSNYVLNEENALALQQMIMEYKRNHRDHTGTEVEIDELLTPEVYVAEVPIGGIPALTLDGGRAIPGKATCNIYKLMPKTGTNDLELVATEFDRIVNNVSKTEISKSTTAYKLVWRDKYGTWVTESKDCECCEDCVLIDDAFYSMDPDTGTGTGSSEGLDVLYEVISGDWILEGSLYTYDENAIIIRREGVGDIPHKNYYKVGISSDIRFGPAPSEHNSEYYIYACWADSDNHLYLKTTYYQERKSFHSSDPSCYPPDMYGGMQWDYIWVECEFYSVIGGVESLEDSWSSYRDQAPWSYYGCRDGGYYAGCQDLADLAGRPFHLCYEDGEVWVYTYKFIWRHIYLGGGTGTGSGTGYYSSLGSRMGFGSGTLGHENLICTSSSLRTNRISTHCPCLCASCQYGTRPETVQVEISGVANYATQGCTDCTDWNSTFLLDTQKMTTHCHVDSDGCPTIESIACSDNYCNWILRTDICGESWVIYLSVRVHSTGRAYILFRIFSTDQLTFLWSGSVAFSRNIWEEAVEFGLECETIDCIDELDGREFTNLYNNDNQEQWTPEHLPWLGEQPFNCDWSNATATITVP